MAAANRKAGTKAFVDHIAAVKGLDEDLVYGSNTSNVILSSRTPGTYTNMGTVSLK